MSTRIARSTSKMRKPPSQARSRATVDAIVEAAARILSSRGWSAFTTNAVADEAGISIGSLYQYFPDKIAIVAAVRDRHLADSLAAIRNAAPGEVSLDIFARRLVNTVVEAHSIHPGLHRVLLDEAPTSEPYRDQNSRFENEYLGLFAKAARAYLQKRDGDDALISGMVLSDAIDGVVHNAARRGQLQSLAVQAELLRLVRSYLTPEPP